MSLLHLFKAFLSEIGEIENQRNRERMYAAIRELYTVLSHKSHGANRYTQLNTVNDWGMWSTCRHKQSVSESEWFLPTPLEAELASTNLDVNITSPVRVTGSLTLKMAATTTSHPSWLPRANNELEYNNCVPWTRGVEGKPERHGGWAGTKGRGPTKLRAQQCTFITDHACARRHFLRRWLSQVES